MPTQYKLWYFNAMGRAELIRLIFAEAGVKYEDHRFAREDWPKIKSTMPSGQVPVLEVDGKKLFGSLPIARFVANEFGLAGKTNLEKQMVDSVIDGLSDLFVAVVALMHEQDIEKKKAGMEKFNTEKLQPFLTLYTKFLGDNGSGYFVGKELTFADLAFYQYLNTLLEKHPDSFVNHPKIIEFLDRVRSRKAIKAWIETRPKTDM